MCVRSNCALKVESSQFMSSGASFSEARQAPFVATLWRRSTPISGYSLTSISTSLLRKLSNRRKPDFSQATLSFDARKGQFSCSSGREQNKEVFEHNESISSEVSSLLSLDNDVRSTTPTSPSRFIRFSHHLPAIITIISYS